MFRAYEPDQDRLVAVKLFRLDLPPDRVHRLVAELQLLIDADVAHPGIAAPIAAGISDVSAYLAMDFVAAESLDTVIRDLGRTSPSDVFRVAGQLASALDLAAAAGVTHGALHPRDVLMSADDARMTGLGIARILETLGVTAPVRRPYTAPERVSGGVWDQRADVFSLAALMFELLTARRISGPGEPPVDGLAGVSNILPDVLLRVFAKALEEDPRDRYATASDFASALLTGLATRPSSSSRPTPARKRVVQEKPVEAPPPPLPAEHLPLLTDEMLEIDAEATTREVVRVAPLGHSVDAPAATPAADDQPPTVAESFSLNEFALDDHDLRGMADDLRLPGQEPEMSPEPTTQGIDVQPRTSRSESEREAASLVLATDASSDPARSAVWPLALAMVVGLALGFGSAMLLLGPDRNAPVQDASASPDRPAPTLVAEEPIRPVTENTVPRPSAAPPDAIPEPPALSPVPLNPRTASPAPSAPANTAAPAGASAPASTSSPARPAVSAPPSAASQTAAKPAPRPVTPAARAPERPPAPKPVPAPARPRTTARPAVVTPPVATKLGPGSVVVESRPDGAIVILDGKIAGKTPLTIDSLPAGRHNVAIDRPGYRRWMSSFEVSSGERSRVAASLER